MVPKRNHAYHAWSWHQLLQTGVHKKVGGVLCAPPTFLHMLESTHINACAL